MPIALLPPLLVNHIAAGEVIERPASVVKELVENSLDAGATRIDIAIEEGGRQLIRISDDGLGIAPDELPLAIAAHATSKLQRPEQLESIATLGFRGEALASIASVSRLRIVSRATVEGKLAEAGAMLDASGDTVGPVTPVAAARGTIIEMRDLFFNTPARRKFMRAASTEFGHIAELVGRIAMVRCEVAFTLSHNGRKTLEVAATASRRQRCLEVLGKELDDGLLEFEDHHREQVEDGPGGVGGAGGYHLWGLAGRPEIARATSKFQYLCVNGRPIKDRNLAHAVREAYRGLVPPDQQPVAVMCIDMPASAVDVNVHPAKTEVRFREPQRIHGLVLSALRQRLIGADLTPAASMGSGFNRAASVFNGSSWPSRSTGGGGGTGDESSGGGGSGGGGGGPISTQGFVDYFRRMDPTQKGFVYQQVKEALAQEDPAIADEPLLTPSQTPAPFGDAITGGQSVPPVLQAQGVLQVHQSYLVTQDEAGILIIDQHALHERVMFEELRKRVTSRGNLESQRMLMPAMLNLPPRQMALVEQLQPLLKRLGIEAQAMGPDALGIHAFSTFLFDRGVDPVTFMEELLDRADDGEFEVSAGEGDGNVDEAVLHEVLDMMSCKAAVKAGDRMSPEELAALLAQREQVERASNCPHGRPTTIRLSLRDLEKQFKRT